MTTSPSEPPTPSRRPQLLIGGAVVVVAAVVGTLLLAKGTEDDGDRQAATTSGAGASSTPTSPGEQEADLSTPEAAAASFAATAGTGSGEALLELACVGHLACATQHVPGVAEPQLSAARSQISEGVYELAVHLKGVEFGAAVDGAVPGTKDVPYRTPEMTASLTLTFVQFEGDWLYYSPIT